MRRWIQNWRAQAAGRGTKLNGGSGDETERSVVDVEGGDEADQGDEEGQRDERPAGLEGGQDQPGAEAEVDEEEGADADGDSGGTNGDCGEAAEVPATADDARVATRSQGQSGEVSSAEGEQGLAQGVTN